MKVNEMNDLTLKQAPVLLWLLNFGIIREGFKNKIEKKWYSGGYFPKSYSEKFDDHCCRFVGDKPSNYGNCVDT